MLNDDTAVWLKRTIALLGTMLIVTNGVSMASHLQDNDDGTVKDLATGLVWQQLASDTTRDWNASVSYCAGLVLGERSEWRLPEVKELSSIIDDRITQPSIDSRMFPETVASYYWSSSYFGDSSRAWIVLFDSVFITSSRKSIARLVRCVHD